MTDRPYTDTDLRTIAARLHAGAARDADERIRPTVQRHWGAQLDVDQIDEACDEVTELLDRTVNVSRWAVDLGADGLTPDEGHVDIPTADGRIGVRIHFAFHPAMPKEMRASVIAAVHSETAAPTAT
jgi:hypothetical protein